MKRYPPLSLAVIAERLIVDTVLGRVYWRDATKHHARLNGMEAGSVRPTSHGKAYCRIKINTVPYLRSHIVFAVATGRWPTEQVDHINGNSLDDRAENLREATQTQNAWNHKTRAKRSALPMGVRRLPRCNGFQARITHNNRQISLGVYPTPEEAHGAYLIKRVELFGEFA